MLAIKPGKPGPITVHSHQAPTLIGCLIVKELCTQAIPCTISPQLPLTSATFEESGLQPAFASLLSQQQRNEIMKKFYRFVKSASRLTSLHPLDGDLFRSRRKILSIFLSSYRNIRVFLTFSTAKPETITQLLQIMQPAFAQFASYLATLLSGRLRFRSNFLSAASDSICIASKVGHTLGWLAILFRPPIRVNPESTSPAKPKTITQFLQSQQLASA
ncbi:hypothetical protein WJ968_00005 [Achromobacter xylosoxidans]